MSFTLTRTKMLTSTKDWEDLKDELDKHSGLVNTNQFLWWKRWSYTTKVLYVVHEPIFSDKGKLRITIMFRSERIDEESKRLGIDMREECINKVVEIANDCLDKDRLRFLITIREDGKNVEEHLYERQ